MTCITIKELTIQRLKEMHKQACEYMATFAMHCSEVEQKSVGTELHPYIVQMNTRLLEEAGKGLLQMMDIEFQHMTASKNNQPVQKRIPFPEDLPRSTPDSSPVD